MFVDRLVFLAVTFIPLDQWFAKSAVTPVALVVNHPGALFAYLRSGFRPDIEKLAPLHEAHPSH
jgi:hypothetical protein